MYAAVPERNAVAEEVSGLIERVTFHNDENGFCVLRVKVRGHRDEVTVIGSLPSVTAGEWLQAEGWWVRDKEHGLQFKARLMKTVPPTTVEGIELRCGPQKPLRVEILRCKRLQLDEMWSWIYCKEKNRTEEIARKNPMLAMFGYGSPSMQIPSWFPHGG